jgi:hypothetical protein
MVASPACTTAKLNVPANVANGRWPVVFDKEMRCESPPKSTVPDISASYGTCVKTVPKCTRNESTLPEFNVPGQRCNRKVPVAFDKGRRARNLARDDRRTRASRWQSAYEDALKSYRAGVDRVLVGASSDVGEQLGSSNRELISDMPVNEA